MWLVFEEQGLAVQCPYVSPDQWVWTSEDTMTCEALDLALQVTDVVCMPRNGCGAMCVPLPEMDTQ